MKTTKKIKHYFRIQYHLHKNNINIALYLFSMLLIYTFVNELILKAMLIIVISTIYGKL